jgi:ATPase subunit of ABC transporter with duplicated ATPase domains
MACHLLSMGWQPHEVNLRLGHTPNSDRLNSYVNYLAIDRHRPKKKLYESQLHALQEELREAKERERLSRMQAVRHSNEGDAARAENRSLWAELDHTKARVEELARLVRGVLVRLPAAGSPPTLAYARGDPGDDS